MSRLRILMVSLLCALLSGCMKWDYGEPEDFDVDVHGLFVLCEGNFQYGNASLSFYSPATGHVENEVFQRANGMKLGDVAHSITLAAGRVWVVVNNSHVIFAISPSTFREQGRIEGLTSPRYIHFVTDRKAYVSQLWDNRIFIVDPATYSVIGHITVPDMTSETGSTEQMVQVGDYVYCCCWSYQNRIIKIDTRTDRVVATLAVGIQPRCLCADRYGRLWALTDGGYDGSPYGHEPPALWCIDPESLTVMRRLALTDGSAPTALIASHDGSELLWLNDGVWRMGVDSPALPSAPVIAEDGRRFYALTVSPESGDVYVADAIDWQQPGMVYRHSADGELIEKFYVGITPGAFCWK